MNTKRLRALLVTALATFAVMALGSTALSAQTPQPTGPTSTCKQTSYTWPGTGFGTTSSVIASSPIGGLGIGTSLTISVLTISAGTFNVTAVGYDGHVGRTTDNQLNEQFHLEFLDAGNGVVGTTSSTGDVPDGVEEGTWSGSLGQVTLSADATQIRAMHSFLGGGVNSVQPICVGLDPFREPPPPTSSTTTTTTTTTSQPPSTTQPPETTQPPTPPPPPPPATIPPIPTLPPPASLPPFDEPPVETSVLPAVEVAQPATPTAGTPVFTG